LFITTGIEKQYTRPLIGHQNCFRGIKFAKNESELRFSSNIIPATISAKHQLVTITSLE